MKLRIMCVYLYAVTVEDQYNLSGCVGDIIK